MLIDARGDKKANFWCLFVEYRQHESAVGRWIADWLQDENFGITGWCRKSVQKLQKHHKRWEMKSWEIIENFRICNFADITAQINENSKRLYDDALCRWPNKKVIEMPQHPSRKYTPRKYVIYRCSDDTACCRSSDKTCVAKRSEEVTLWFHVRIVSSNIPQKCGSTDSVLVNWSRLICREQLRRLMMKYRLKDPEKFPCESQ